MTRMTREEAIKILKFERGYFCDFKGCQEQQAFAMAIKSLEQEPCEDCISREKAKQFLYERIDRLNDDELYDIFSRIIDDMYNELPSATPQPKIGYCKDCKWWKDSDGVYRRDCYTESKCPMNRREVFEGNGYCYIFEPKMQEVEE